ncbi:DNA repair protein RecO [Rubrivirga sp. S365]|uniref:DNA repair protein RecO n=1 Tax=Rubrivirga litoralis TaxID=3075598 RepID=A0ABU3BLZ5_9BACT|nr:MULTISPECIES: DNA repair protein RecO [unclassified Rubrivirga]MDT0630283.1 DNA repair protein RecO [Rubrivirga sp. F394]MDT7855795.1 DNA repair protein RecO [Rubrivirga sp. S365]
MIVRTDAVVLHAFDYGETSRIVRLLTRQHGVIGVIARGARRPTSQFGSALQPMSYVQAVYYYRPQRGLQTLKEAAPIVRWRRLGTDLDRVTLGLRVVEIARALLGEGEAHPLAVNLVTQTLDFIDESDDRPANALPWFQLRLAALLGFSPDVQREDVLALGDDGGRLLLQSGTVLAAGADAAERGRASSGVRASRPALRAFAVFARTDLPTAGRMRLDEPTRREVESLADAYLRTHTEATYPERVRQVSDQIDAALAAARGGADSSGGAAGRGGTG